MLEGEGVVVSFLPVEESVDEVLERGHCLKVSGDGMLRWVQYVGGRRFAKRCGNYRRRDGEFQCRIFYSRGQTQGNVERCSPRQRVCLTSDTMVIVCHSLTSK